MASNGNGYYSSALARAVIFKSATENKTDSACQYVVSLDTESKWVTCKLCGHPLSMIWLELVVMFNPIKWFL